MCGIAGFQGRFEHDLHERMAATIAHRGPDDDGALLLPHEDPRRTVGLGFRRLSIIDLSAAGHQPMRVHCASCAAADHDVVIVYNGEIYNHRELRAELERDGHRFRSGTDTEVLLHLYAVAGHAMLERLNGIFGFAIYDGRARGRPAGVEQGDLFIARDHLGVKPLYYAETNDGLIFASELKALLHEPTLSRELDLVAVHETLAYLWTPSPRTLFAGVRKLEPGHALLARAGRIVRTWCHYDLPYGAAPLTDSASTIAGALRERVFRAVERQLVADVPVGAFLSGGLDSSAVVAGMKRAAPGSRPVCYTIGFDDSAGEVDAADLPYARRVAWHLGAELREIHVEASIIDRLEHVLGLLDEPNADPATINTLLIAEQARADGIPVLLSGTGGDDLFSGYRRHVALRYERYWDWLPGALRARLAEPARRIYGGAGRVGGGGALRRVSKALSHADLDADHRTVSYFWWGTEELRRALYSPAMARAVAQSATGAPLLASLARIPGEHDPLNRMLYLEAKHFLADHNLNYTDKMGMAAGVEIRVPLLDVELVEFATRIPASLKQSGRTGKAILKQAMEGVLPSEVIHRPKTGFGAPLRRWLRYELRDMVEDTLSVTALSNRGLFDPAAVRRLIELDRQGRVDAAYTIFALMCIELWCRLFADARRPAAVAA